MLTNLQRLFSKKIYKIRKPWINRMSKNHTDTANAHITNDAFQRKYQYYEYSTQTFAFLHKWCIDFVISFKK